MNKNNSRKTIWIYAVILFTSAFIVLIWTGYSQIKFNKNIEDYKSRLSNKEIESNKFQYNLSSALAENKKLVDEINNLSEKLSEIEKKNENLERELTGIKNKNSSTLSSYEQVLKADNEYNNGNIRESVLILLRIDTFHLSEQALNKYYDLINKTYKKAAHLFYREGYNSYKKKEYDKAIENLELSLRLANKEYFSDDSYYYIAYSNYNLNNKEQSKEALNNLITEYPESSYYNEAKDLLEKIG